MTEEDRRVVAAVIVQNGRILLVQNEQQFWILPGGKCESGEDEKTGLRRELTEELPGMQAEILEKFGVFSGLTPHSRRPVDIDVYLVQATGTSYPGMEIKATRWVRDWRNLPVSALTVDILQALEQKGRL